MRPIRWIIGTSLVGLGAALLITRRELEEERQAHRETVLALETIKQVSAPAGDS
jgi:nucleoside recognition membrane protein YjiH